jgi:2-haloacid dehalogenase
MSLASIRFVSFDCYGTLTNFRVGDVTRDRLAGRVGPDRMPAFLSDFSAYRFDEVLGAWKPYAEVLHRSLERTCRCWGVDFDPTDAQAIVDAVPTWGPHADHQIQANVDKLGAPFHAVLTAQQAQAYKPRFQAFEYMFDTLGCGPEHFLHVSSSLRYDLMSAHDLHIGQRVFVDRGHGPGNPEYGYQRIDDLGGLPGVLGLGNGGR